MSRKKLFNILAYLIISLFLINSLALRFYWYYSMWYFDVFMHFFGGFCAGVGMVWLLSYKNPPSRLSFGLFWKAILGILLIGVFWEIFEILFNNVIAQTPFDLLDTASDIFLDLAGGVLATFFFFKKVMPKPDNHI